MQSHSEMILKDARGNDDQFQQNETLTTLNVARVAIVAAAVSLQTAALSESIWFGAQMDDVARASQMREFCRVV